MTPGYTHISKREAQSVAQLGASIKEKNRLLVSVDKARAKVQGKLDLAEERVKTLAKANATLVEEVKAFKAKVEELEAQETPAPVEPARDDNQLRINGTQQAAKAYRETNGVLSSQVEGLVEAGAVIPGQVLTIHDGKVVIHQRNLDLPSLAQTLRQAAEAVTAHALTEELA